MLSRLALAASIALIAAPAIAESYSLMCQNPGRLLDHLDGG